MATHSSTLAWRAAIYGVSQSQTRLSDIKRNILALIRVKNISSDRNSQVSHRFIIYTIDFDRQINTEEAMCPGFVSFRLSTHCWGPAFLSPKARTLW